MRAIAILGSGPAGMAATWACAMRGYMTVVISDTDKPSRIGGAQFLHRPLPEPGSGDLPKPDFTITYQRWGTMESYRDKVYGDVRPKPESSWDRVVTNEPVQAWSLRERYNQLFHLLTSDGDRVNVTKVGPEQLGDLLADPSFVRIISTIPKNQLCFGGCSFTGVPIRLAQGRYFSVPDNTVIYNGDPEYSWARASNIDGQEWTEWGDGSQAIPVDEEAQIRFAKPVAHTCKCWDNEEKLMFAGRFGTWSKGKLVDDAFYDVVRSLS